MGTAAAALGLVEAAARNAAQLAAASYLSMFCLPPLPQTSFYYFRLATAQPDHGQQGRERAAEPPHLVQERVRLLQQRWQ